MKQRAPRQLACVAFLISVLAACSPSLTESELLARATTAFESGDYAAAELDIKSALQQNPDNAAARVLYGRLFIRRASPDAAVDEFERALATQRSPDTLLLLVKALIENGDAAELVSDFDAGRYVVLQDNPEFQAALARAYLAQEEPEKAEQSLAAIDIEDNDYVDLSRAVYSLIVDGDAEAAEAMLEAVTTRSPSNAQAWSMRGVVAANLNRLEEAEGFFAEAANANPFRIADRLQLANTQLRLGKGDDADADLAQLAKMIPRSPEVNYLRGRLLFDRGEYKEAIEAFSLVLAANPNHVGAMLLSANANALTDNLATAEAMYTDFLALVPGNVEATLRLAEVNRRLGNARRTEDLARAVLGADAENERALALLGASLSAQGQHAESALAFDELATLQPDLPAVRVAAGTQRVAAGDEEAGIQQLRDAAKLMPESGAARERLIEALLSVGDLEEAASEADAYVAQMPESARPHVYRGRLKLQQRQSDEARAEFDRALELDPGNIDANRGLAALAVLDQDIPTAIQYLRSALEAHPENVVTHMSLAVLLEQAGDTESMVKTLRSAVDVDPKAVEPRLALARYGLAQETPGEAVTLLSEIESDNLEDSRVQLVLATAYMALGDPRAALLRAERLLAQRPEDPSTLNLVAYVERANGRDDDALAHLETLLSIQPDARQGRLQLIDLLFARRQFPRVREEIARLPTELQETAPMLVLRGRLALFESDNASAEQLFSKAFDLSPESINLALLAAAKWAQDERDETMALLSGWLEENPEDNTIRGELASRYLQVGREDEAAAQYRTILEAQPENVIALNNLGWLLRKTDTEAALAFIKKADKLAPDAGAIKDTYAMVALEDGNIELALALNDRAIAAEPDDAAMRLNRARILLRGGRAGEAKDVLKEIIAGPESAAQAEARELIATI